MVNNKKLSLFSSKKYLFFIVFLVWSIILSVLFLLVHPISKGFFSFFLLSSKVKLGVFLHTLLKGLFLFILSMGIIFNSYLLGAMFFYFIKIKLSRLEHIFFSISLGLGFLAYIIFLFGIFHLFYHIFFVIFWLILTPISIYIFIKNIDYHSINTKFSTKNPILIISIIILFLVFFLNLLVSFAPEIFYDSLNYHLGVPNFYIQYHKILPMPYKTYSNFPMTVSMLYVYGMLLQGPIIAKLLNLLFGIITIIGLLVISKKITKGYFVGIIASIIFYTTPNVMFRSWTATNDLGLTLFVTLSIIALIYAIRNNSNKWLIISGIAMGFAAGSKYTAIFFILGWGIVLFIFFKPKNTILALLFMLLFFSPWLIKNYIFTGNPFHPMFAKHFHVKYPHNVHKSPTSNFFPHNKNEFLKRVKQIFYMPFVISIEGGGTKKYMLLDYYMLGILYLMFIPLIIFIKKTKDKNIFAILSIFIFFSFLFWALFSEWQIKYLTPAFPIFAFLISLSICHLNGALKSNLKNIFYGFILFFSLYNFLYTIPFAYYFEKPLDFLYGTISKDQFLSYSQATYPNPSYAVYKYINEKLPQNIKVLIFGDAKCLYIDRKFTAYSVGGLNPLIEFVHHSKSASSLYQLLKEKHYSYLVVNVNEGIRTGIFGNLYFEKGDFHILDNFFNQYLKKIYSYNNVYLYKITSNNEKKEDTVKNIFRQYILEQVNELLSQKKYNNAIKSLDNLIKTGVKDDFILYAKGVSYFYLGEKEKALMFAKEAYQQNPKQLYKKLIDILSH